MFRTLKTITAVLPLKFVNTPLVITYLLKYFTGRYDGRNDTHDSHESKTLLSFPLTNKLVYNQQLRKQGEEGKPYNVSFVKPVYY